MSESDPIARLCVVETTGLAKGIAEGQLRGKIVRLQTQSFPGVGFRLFQPPLESQQVTEIVQGPGESWLELAGFAKLHLRLVETAQLDEKTTKIVMDVRKCRVEAQGLAIATLAFLESGQIEQHYPKVAMGRRKIRPLPQHMAKLADRIVELLPPGQQIGEIETGIDLSAGDVEVESGGTSQHEPIMGLRAREVPALTQQGAELIMHIQIVGFVQQRLPVARDGLVPSSESAQSSGHVAMMDAVGGLKLYDAGDDIERPVGLVCLEQGNSQEVQTVGMIRLGCQYLPINRLRLRQAACAMVRQSGLE
ncbi:hypothetical protein [Bradyrhizobium sp. CB2312]|uniref:hypothetical protein n=1 Tax=Bradyrhizobium sp. CB2312 TaxID=3039155 RepID=UPI0024B09E7A|nr:hypothetical protein [Bradyrhizobium sp. CB2312]WFU77238.1 hypothetical protein QA642_27195 [Bradyrhizobium sp. CB2312]